MTRFPWVVLITGGHGSTEGGGPLYQLAPLPPNSHDQATTSRVSARIRRRQCMRRRSGLWSLLSLLMIAGLVATACTSTPGNTTPSAATDNLDPNGEITTNTGSEPDTIDPQKESFVNEVAQTMQVFEALLALDPKTLKPVATGAAKALPTLSSDGLTYTFTLRDGLKYS